MLARMKLLSSSGIMLLGRMQAPWGGNRDDDCTRPGCQSRAARATTGGWHPLWRVQGDAAREPACELDFRRHPGKLAIAHKCRALARRCRRVARDRRVTASQGSHV